MGLTVVRKRAASRSHQGGLTETPDSSPRSRFGAASAAGLRLTVGSGVWAALDNSSCGATLSATS